MATIKKPTANPIVALLLSLILFLGHFVINGQKRKWLFILLTFFIGYLACCLGEIVVAVLALIDAYQTAVRLKNGEEIDENEYTNEMLYKIVKYIDKTAVYKGTPKS